MARSTQVPNAKIYNRGLTCLSLKNGGYVFNYGTVTTPVPVRAYTFDVNGDIVYSTGTVDPTSSLNNAAGFAKGAIFVKTDAADGTPGSYQNIGTALDTNWELYSSISDGEVTNVKVADTNGAGQLAIKKIAIVAYDFAVDGGVAGTIALTGAPTIPDKAVVWVESYRVVTTCTSAADTATIALQLPTDGALTTAIAINDGSNPWDQGAFVVSQGGLATPLPKVTTAARVPSLVVGVQNLTAGKIVFQLGYYISAA